VIETPRSIGRKSAPLARDVGCGPRRTDSTQAIDAADLESAAVAAYHTGRDEDYLTLRERAYRAYLDDGAAARVVRSAALETAKPNVNIHSSTEGDHR